MAGDGVSFWDDKAGYDIRDRKHPNFANAARGLRELVRSTPPRRFLCDLGCGADFLTVEERELHIVVEHGKDAA